MFSRKQLIKLLAPLIVEQIMTVLVGMVDVMMVSAVGESAVSGVSLVDSISILILQIMGALATGGAVIASQYLGKSEPQNARKAAGQLVMVTMVLSLVITLAALIGNRYLLSLIFGKVEAEVMDNAQTYFWITALSYPFIGLYNACAALFRSMGNSKVSMMTSFVMNAVNVIGNGICVFVLNMGVAGVAWPTLISRVLAAGMMFVLIQNRQNSIRLHRLQVLLPDRGMIKNILSIGIPSGLESGMFQFGKIFLQSLVSSLGTSAIAGYAVAGNLVTVLYLPGTALGLGLITIVGQCVGAGRVKEAKGYTRKLTALTYGIVAVLSVALAVFAEPLVEIYNLGGASGALAGKLIVVHSIAMIAWPLAFTLPYSFRASMDAKFTMAVSVFSMWMFRIGSAYLFVYVFQMGVMGIWYGMFIDWIFRAIFFVWRFRGFENRAVSVK